MARASNSKRTKSQSEKPDRPPVDPPAGVPLTTDQGIRIPHTDDSLKAGSSGPTLLEDFHLREKITHFDHERIPERVVHARGTGAHGFFRVYESLEDLTQADFLCDPDARTPVFVRFSTVVGSRGSADTVRDARGFATKFYTRAGNFDLVGNNIPVFFIQDGIKFPDLVHAIKPEPHDEMPQAGSAHDTFWDFVSLVPETLHMVLWVMSDRGIPRSYRMMEGFGVHTFRLVNARGKSRFVKFHWKPILGVHSLVWDEAQKISGKDPDFHRRDLREAIDAGQPAEYELGIQVVEEKDRLAFGFDLLDATKLLPEELVPVRRVGRLTLDRNPKNFFSEVEQVAFCIGNIVPGIDFSDDPLLQVRLFSYLDTQLLRLGGPNFAQIPINRPVAGVHNHHQDGLMQQRIPDVEALYHPNTVAGGQPPLASAAEGFAHYRSPVEGRKSRERSPTFADHFSQARLFLKSQSAPERLHLVEACIFELGKVRRPEIRERVVAHFASIDDDFAKEIAKEIGVAAPVSASSKSGAAKGRKVSAEEPKSMLEKSPSLSILNSPGPSIATRKVALLVAAGVRGQDIARISAALEREGAVVDIVGPSLEPLATEEGDTVVPLKSLLTTHSVFYDAVVVPGGARSIEVLKNKCAVFEVLQDAWKHSKTIGAIGEGVELLSSVGLPGRMVSSEVPTAGTMAEGVVTAPAGRSKPFIRDLITAITAHRHFKRPVHLPPQQSVEGG